MFTGIIECMGIIREIRSEGSNRVFSIESPFSSELKVDQSVSHDGVCLTIEEIDGIQYQVTAIEETLQRSNLAQWKKGDLLNLERSMKLGDRLDGHIVQGHVDQVAICAQIEELNGSWMFTFNLNSDGGLIVNKGSITVNGTSLTVVDPGPSRFSVAIIPYTYDHTNFKNLKVGDRVNIEFDVIGKYVSRLMEERN